MFCWLSDKVYFRADGKFKLGIVWVFVHPIFGPCWPLNQLNKKPKHCLTSDFLFIQLCLLPYCKLYFSVNLDTFDDIEISAEAHAELNSYLVKVLYGHFPKIKISCPVIPVST